MVLQQEKKVEQGHFERVRITITKKEELFGIKVFSSLNKCYPGLQPEINPMITYTIIVSAVPNMLTY